MNQIDKDIELGKSIIRAEGINLSEFKRRVNSMLDGRKMTDEDHWVMLYQFYAEIRSDYCQTVEEWANEHFIGFTIDKHGIELKKDIKF